MILTTMLKVSFSVTYCLKCFFPVMGKARKLKHTVVHIEQTKGVGEKRIPVIHLPIAPAHTLVQTMGYTDWYCVPTFPILNILLKFL